MIAAGLYAAMLAPMEFSLFKNITQDLTGFGYLTFAAHSAQIFGYYLLFVFCILFLKPYSMQAFLFLAFTYFCCFRIYEKTKSRFLLGNFALGTIALFFIILPILNYYGQSIG